MLTFKYPSQFTSKEENFFFFVKTEDIDLFREMAIFSQYLRNVLGTLLHMKFG